MQQKTKFTWDRKRKSEVPFGWSQVHKTTLSGAITVEWRCPHIHINTFTQKYERCSYTCRKDRTNNKHQHIYKIPPEEDDLLDEKYKNIPKEFFFIKLLMNLLCNNLKKLQLNLLDLLQYLLPLLVQINLGSFFAIFLK